MLSAEVGSYNLGGEWISLVSLGQQGIKMGTPIGGRNVRQQTQILGLLVRLHSVPLSFFLFFFTLVLLSGECICFALEGAGTIGDFKGEP